MIHPVRKRPLLMPLTTVSSVWALSAVMCAAGLAPAPAIAQDWNPFAEANPIRPPPKREARPAQEAPRPTPANPTPTTPQQAPNDDALPPLGNGPAAPQRETVERADLAPLTDSGPGSSGPSGAGAAGSTGGYNPRTIEPLLTGLDIPSRSPALTGLLRRLMAGPEALLTGDGAEQIGVRAEALYRAGLVGDAAALLPAKTQEGDNPVLAALTARIAVAAGRREQACDAMRVAIPARANLPGPLKGDILAIQGFCAAADGNASAAGLSAALAREERIGSPDTLAALDAVAGGDLPKLAAAKRLVALDYRLAETVKADGQRIGPLPLERAEPALLAALASGTGAETDPKLRLDAAEAASRLNIIDPAGLANVYRQQTFTAAELGSVQISPQAAAAQTHAPSRRALLWRAAEAERTPARKTRLVRAVLDEARRAGIYLSVASALAPVVDTIVPAVEIGWFAETAIETFLAAGQFDKARTWTRFGQQSGTIQDHSIGSLAHWRALIDIADPTQTTPRGEHLASVEDLALRSRFTTDGLHRLATVLDALDYDVPHRLWEAASRSPQPNAGHLPPTGVLPDLQDAAKKKDQARVILLVIRALGPTASEGAHIIALGDSIRALRRAGLDREARQLALEALFASWPKALQT